MKANIKSDLFVAEFEMDREEIIFLSIGILTSVLAGVGFSAILGILT